MVSKQVTICRRILLFENLDCGKQSVQPRTLHLPGLLLEIPLGDHDEFVALAQIVKSFGDARQQLDLVVGDGVGESDDAGMLFGRHGCICELLEAGDQRDSKAFEAVTVLRNRFVFTGVQVLANFLAGVHGMVEEGDEGCDGAFKIDVVFPQCVISVEKQGLIGEAGYCRRGGHLSIIEVRSCGVDVASDFAAWPKFGSLQKGFVTRTKHSIS